MTIKYQSGRRIQATATDFEGIPAVSGGWKELGRTTLGSGNTNIDVSSLSDKRYYMVLEDVKGTSIAPTIRLNTDTGSNYAKRYSNNGGSDSTGTSNSNIDLNLGGSASNPYFNIHYISNLSTKEKLLITNQVEQRTAGAGNAPSRAEVVSKWANTSSSINAWKQYNGVGGNYNTGSEVVVLGWDDSDTHSTNFWEELADVSLSSTNTSLDSGTFTAKKYLWVQMYQKGMTGNNTLYNFNSDTGSNYARRWKIDGGTEFTTGSTTGLMCHNAVGTQTDNFFNMFIVNNSANEKLVISHSAYTISTGAGSAPSREEHVGKWANTSSQITSIQFDHGGSNFGIGSSIKVWGSN